MDKEYLTVKDAMAHTGKSEETIRRWIRSIRSQYLINLDDTNEQLAQKATLLRKQNESEPDGAPRQDRHGSPVFDWLLLREALDESFPAAEGQAPPHLFGEDTNDVTQPTGEDTPDHTQSKDDDTHEGLPESTHDNTHQPPEDTNDNHQEQYMWIPREVYQDLLAQLDKKDLQIERKDGQLDGLLDRHREANVLLQGYQRKFGALPAPTTRDEIAIAGNESHDTGDYQQ